MNICKIINNINIEKQSENIIIKIIKIVNLKLIN